MGLGIGDPAIVKARAPFALRLECGERVVRGHNPTEGRAAKTGASQIRHRLTIEKGGPTLGETLTVFANRIVGLKGIKHL